MKQRIISLCLAVALIFSVLPQMSIRSNAAQKGQVAYEMREEVRVGPSENFV